MSLSPDEARAWLRGERSMTNIMMSAEPGDQAEYRQQTLVAIEQADAAACAAAYWVLRAEREGLA